MATLGLSDLIAARDQAYAAWQAALTSKSAGSDGTSFVTQDIAALYSQFLKLNMFVGRMDGSAPMIVRGVLRGLSGSPSR